MSVWDDMAYDAGARGEEAREMAAQIEEEELRRSEYSCRDEEEVEPVTEWDANDYNDMRDFQDAARSERYQEAYHDAAEEEAYEQELHCVCGFSWRPGWQPRGVRSVAAKLEENPRRCPVCGSLEKRRG